MVATNPRQETGEVLLVQVHEPSDQALYAEIYDTIPSARELFRPLFDSASSVEGDEEWTRATIPPAEVDVMEYAGEARYTTIRQYEDDDRQKNGDPLEPVYICLFAQNPQQIGISIIRFGSGYRVSVTEAAHPVYQYVLADDTLCLEPQTDEE